MDLSSLETDLIGFQAHAEAVRPQDLSHKGHVFVTPSLLPYGSEFLGQHGAKDHGHFQVKFIRRTLALLELVVLNDRLLVGHPGQYTVAEEAFETRTFRRYIASENAYIKLGHALISLADRLKRDLEGAFVRHVFVTGAQATPIDYVTRYLNSNASLHQAYAAICDEFHKTEHNHAIVHNLAVLKLANSFGALMYTRDACGSGHVPCVLFANDLEAVKTVEEHELNKQTNLIAFLKDRLDAGARSELQRLSDLGVETVFPETPIAMQILSESQSIDDLVPIALQLRDTYAGFRRHMVELEHELTSDDITIQRKLKLLAAVDSMAEQLWPRDNVGLRKATVELSGLTELLDRTSVALAGGLTRQLLGLPIEMIMAAVRKRRVRGMLRSKRAFLRSKAIREHLARLLGRSVEKGQVGIIQESTETRLDSLQRLHAAQYITFGEPGDTGEHSERSQFHSSLAQSADSTDYDDTASALQTLFTSPDGRLWLQPPFNFADGQQSQPNRDLDKARAFFQQALTAWANVSDMANVGSCYHALGMVEREAGNIETAKGHYLKALQVHQGQPDRPLGLAPTYHEMGIIAEVEGDARLDRKYYMRSLRTTLRLGHPGAARTCTQLGRLAESQQDLKAAKQWYRRAVRISEDTDPRVAAVTCDELGRVALLEKKFAKARTWYLRALRKHRSTGDEYGIAITRGNLGLLAIEQGRLERAAALVIGAVGALNRLGAPETASSSLRDAFTAVVGRGGDARAGARRGLGAGAGLGDLR